jgi:hypothetical protein
MDDQIPAGRDVSCAPGNVLQIWETAHVVTLTTRRKVFHSHNLKLHPKGHTDTWLGRMLWEAFGSHGNTQSWLHCQNKISQQQHRIFPHTPPV